MLRSRPVGRAGAAAGSSPRATRSVQSAYICSARVRPTCVKRALIAPPAWPDWMRRSHAATESSNEPSAFGISRVALPPIWWHAVQASVATMLRTHSPWLLMFCAMPLPPGPLPVPGKSLLGGSCIIDHQYCAG